MFQRNLSNSFRTGTPACHLPPLGLRTSRFVGCFWRPRLAEELRSEEFGPEGRTLRGGERGSDWMLPPPNSFRRGTTAESERVHPPHGTCQKDRPHRTVPYRYLLDSPLFTPILNLATSHTVVHFSVRSLCRFGLLPTLNRDVGGRTRRPSQLFGASGSRLGGASQGASGPRWRESGRFPPKPLSK